MSISLSKPNEADERNGSCVRGDNGSVDVLPTALLVSLLSSSTSPNAANESNGGRVSNVANIGVDGGTRGLLFNDDDRDDGSCLTRLELTTAIAGELFMAVDGELIGIPLDKHLRSNS